MTEKITDSCNEETLAVKSPCNDAMSTDEAEVSDNPSDGNEGDLEEDANIVEGDYFNR